VAIVRRGWISRDVADQLQADGNVASEEPFNSGAVRCRRGPMAISTCSRFAQMTQGLRMSGLAAALWNDDRCGGPGDAGGIVYPALGLFRRTLEANETRAALRLSEGRINGETRRCPLFSTTTAANRGLFLPRAAGAHRSGAARVRTVLARSTSNGTGRSHPRLDQPRPCPLRCAGHAQTGAEKCLASVECPLGCCKREDCCGFVVTRQAQYPLK